MPTTEKNSGKGIILTKNYPIKMRVWQFQVIFDFAPSKFGQLGLDPLVETWALSLEGIIIFESLVSF